MPYHDDVIGRMVSNLWFQVALTPPPSPATGAGAGTGAGHVVGPLRTPPDLFGVPEHVPELTYIIAAPPDGDDAIQTANDYHDTYGLNPTSFSSLENLVDILRQGSGHIGRLRVVAHIGLDTTSGADANMNVPLFQGDHPDILVGKLRALANSDAACLRALLKPSNAITPTAPLFTNLTASILTYLRGAPAPVPTVLTPFGLGGSTTTPSGNVEQFLFALSDQLVESLTRASAANGTINWQDSATTTANFGPERATLTNALRLIREHVERVAVAGGHTATDLENLRLAVLGLTMQNLRRANVGTNTLEFRTTGPGGVIIYLNPMTPVGNAYAAMTTRNFRTRLETMRTRFDRNSYIDIRGCRIGQDQNYLRALRDFFGAQGDLPTVSGPEWFQSFPFCHWRALADEPAVNNLWDTGITFTVSIPSGGTQTITHSAQTIQDMFARVQTLSGVDIHIDFWRQVAQLDLVAFAAMLWKSDLPLLPITPPRLEGFTGMDFSDTMNRIADIFDINPNPLLPATRTRINNVRAHLAALVSEIIVIDEWAPPASPSASELSASFSRLQTINTGLSLSTVPATAPSPIQVSHLQTYSERLKKYFEIAKIPTVTASVSTNFYQAYIAVEELAATPSPSAADLTARFNDLAAVQTAIGATGIVPASQPPGLDAATLQGYIQPLINHLHSSADLPAFAQAVLAKTQQTLLQPPPAFRYYFFIGLPLLVDEMNNRCFFVLDSQKTPAIRSFMRAHWQEPLPTSNNVGSVTMNQEASRQIAMQAVTNNAGTETAHYINPYPNYDNHIVKVP